MTGSFDEILEDAQQSWMDIDGVVAVAQGERDGQACITVYVDQQSPEARRQIPATYKGVAVEVRESGPISAQVPGRL